MLFPYIFINHSIEKLQGYIEHTVLEVWCKATGAFDMNKLHKDFKPIVQKNKKFLQGPITEIFELFAKLKEAEKKLIADGFKRNNNIEGICNGTVVPFRYTDMDAIDKVLSAKVNSFFKNLYSDVLKISVVKKECGDLDEHYDAFMITNAHGKCPFCGLGDIKSNLLSKRDAYDHYLPKDIYPFNSVNFKNLVPCCNTCNSSYKLVKDPVYDKAGNKPRKAFYPFGTIKPDSIVFNVKVNALDSHDPKQNNIDLSFSSATNAEEIEAWRDVYGMDERYLDKCKSEDAKLWLDQIIDELKNYELDPKAYFPRYIAVRKRQANYLEYNFIRVPFLESCFNKGYIK